MRMLIMLGLVGSGCGGMLAEVQVLPPRYATIAEVTQVWGEPCASDHFTQEHVLRMCAELPAKYIAACEESALKASVFDVEYYCTSASHYVADADGRILYGFWYVGS